MFGVLFPDVIVLQYSYRSPARSANIRVYSNYANICATIKRLMHSLNLDLHGQPAHGSQILEGFIHGRATRAKPDTGAAANFMSLSMAESLGLELNHSSPTSRIGFPMANGKNIWSIAQVSAQWRFRSEVSYSYELNFHVLANFVYDVVIGTAFLQSTETMSVYRNRLSWTPRPTSALAVRNVNLLGDPNQRLRGKLNGELASALPDTGAEPNLVSWDYAKRRGWVGHSLASSRSLLQFPDGSLIEAEGQVRAKWRYDYGQGVSPSSFITFEVVRDLRFDIVLGQDFLEDTDAYTSHAICFYEARTKDQPIGFCLVIWYSRKAKQNPTNSST